LKHVLSDFCQGYEDWRHLLDGIRAYPLTSLLEPQRVALVRGLTAEYARPAPQVGTLAQGLTASLSAPAPLAAAPASEPSPEPRPSSASAAGSAPAWPPTPGCTCIFADVHANLPALEAVLAFAATAGVTRYLFLGDVVSYGPFPGQCIRRLAELNQAVLLRGNHDHTSGTGVPENGSNRVARTMDLWTYQQLTPEERDWLLALPVEHIERPWMSVHGAPQDPHKFYAYVYELTYQDNLAYIAGQQCLACFYGHTHVQFVYRRLADGGAQKYAPATLDLFQPGETMLINPGSVGQPRDGDPRAACAIWDHAANRLSFHRLTYPVATTVAAVKQAGLPEDLIYRLEEGR
jgi:diadenosine tetraphosphatase ApaH/serine/threonine PP2A family protein phosphatase